MITLRDASYSYPKKADALTGITCEVHPGIHLLMGANGTGKTTLLHLMAALRYPTSGVCLLDGEELRLRRPSQLCRVQYFSPDMDFPESSVEKMVSRHAPFFPRFDAAMLSRNLAAFGIDSRRKFTSLSYGNAIKARLAYMLALRCEVLLLDEPTVGLDFEGRGQFGRLLMECIDEDQTVVVSTHSLSEFEPLYDSVMFLRDGCLLLQASFGKISRRVMSVVTATPPADAIYSEMRMGRCHSIVPAGEDDMDSAPDCTLLYNALSSTSADELLRVINA